MATSRTLMTVLAAAALCGASVAHAQPVGIETVPVGNPGNAGDVSSDGNYGAVGHAFSIGRFEVTAGEYTAFLDAVAASDPEGLYHPWMDYDANPARRGCNIKRHGSPGSYTYSVAPDWADRPVNYVSWGDAARFANWLHNGQPTGAQGLTTTEDGAYFLDGRNSDAALEDVVREPDATWAIASEDEWYKAAYHRNDGVTGSYWSNPTGADGAVSGQVVDPDPGHNATCSNPLGAPYYRTQVGEHENSESPYGTFDQGGNVMEFTELVPEPDIRRMRGGSWNMGCSQVSSSQVDDVMHSSDQFADLGFRVVSLMEGPGGPVCGDAVCEGAENPVTCAADCPPECGDGLCSADEDPLGCAVDCPDVCGDGLCTGSESPLTCSQDCADVCGDGLCSGAESSASCPADCAPVCGDGVVEGDEDCELGVPLAETCQSLGFDQGTLACSASTCGYDTSDCSLNQCLPSRAFCSEDADCCSGDCRGSFWRRCR